MGFFRTARKLQTNGNSDLSNKNNESIDPGTVNAFPEIENLKNLHKILMLKKKWGRVNLPYDAMSLLKGIDLLKDREVVKIAELGVAEGHTGNRIVEYCNLIGISNIEYVGIDDRSFPTTVAKPEFENMKFVSGTSNYFDDINGYFDLVFVDACHCCECVFTDSRKASKAIKPSGLMVFHDTSLCAQFPISEYTRQEFQHYGKHPTPPRPLAVVEGITSSRFTWDGNWRLVSQENDGLAWGGVRIYQKE